MANDKVDEETKKKRKRALKGKKKAESRNFFERVFMSNPNRVKGEMDRIGWADKEK